MLRILFVRVSFHNRTTSISNYLIKFKDSSI